MADLYEEIRRQSARAFSGSERQHIRFFLERDVTSERFKVIFGRWAKYLAAALAAGVSAATIYSSFFGKGL